MCIFTLNVIVLTIACLSAMLGPAAEEQAGIIALQEIKRPWHGFRWATKMVTDTGWKVHWSNPLGVTVTGGRRAAGGTALLWRRKLGRGDAFKSLASNELLHRACGRA